MKFIHCPLYFLTKNRSRLLSITFTLILSVPAELFSNPLAPSESEFQWPVVLGKYPDLRGITSTFGESRYDHFHTGLDISGLKKEVYPVASGTILYSREATDDPFAPQMGPGNFMVLDHGKGRWSGYYHLLSINDGKREGTVTPEDAVALTGNTGHSMGAHLHFFITARNGGVYLNPLSLLPKATDRTAPKIGNIVIKTPTSLTMISPYRKETIRLTRAYPILVKIIDPGLESSLRRGAYTLKWTLNGAQIEQRSFERITYGTGGWLLDGKFDFNSVFSEEYYNLGDLPFRDGDNTLVILATDFNGNTSEAIFTIHVKREF